MKYSKSLSVVLVLFVSLFASSVAFAEGVDQEVCGFELLEEGEVAHDAEVVAVRRQLRVEVGDTFRVKVFLKNTGNMPWFSDESSCAGPRMYLGTDKERDRDSVFYSPELEGIDDTNWIGANRIGMDQLRIEPGEIASFTFWSQAPDEPDVVVEYFAPVLSGVQWIEGAEVSFEMLIGDTGENPVDTRKRLSYAFESGSLMDINLDGEKSILVDLSEQVMYVKLDDDVIRSFRVSTGAAKTPTPAGTTSITLKQEVRVGNAAPHYIMPYFQMFRAGGYGLHSLPSLGNDGGVFWTEAVAHLGTPVSHGCIRIADDNAVWLFGFTEIGTPLTVQS
ncbi:MAG: L,D-transpeptidase family protein [Nitrospirae bacterium]|nr:L,D-transpeptidase family protein [Nitrospirota bacterium]